MVLLTKQSRIAALQFETERYIRSTYPVLSLPLYRLDGSQFISQDARGHLCTVTGALWTPQGRRFDGTDDYVVIPYTTSLDLGNTDFTIIAWVNMSSVATNRNFVATWKDATHYGWTLQYTAGAVNKFEFYATKTGAIAGGYLYLQGTTTPAIINTWYMVSATYQDGVVAKLYVNNTEEDSDTWPATNNVVSLTNNIYVGIREETLGNDMAGLIDEVLIYKGRAMTPLELQNIRLETKWRYL